LIQEAVSEGLAAAMNRPLDYTPVVCSGTGGRVKHAALGAVTDELPNGSHPIAVPRIVGAYTGAFLQTTWRPGGSRAGNALLSGSETLVSAR